jgi:hypothetical protein
MSEYSVKQIGREFTILALGAPVLKFASRAEAESVLAEVRNLSLRPKLRPPDDLPASVCAETVTADFESLAHNHQIRTCLAL